MLLAFNLECNLWSMESCLRCGRNLMTVDWGTEGSSFSVDSSLAVHWGFLFYAFIILCVLGIKLHLNICKYGQNNNKIQKIHKKTNFSKQRSTLYFLQLNSGFSQHQKRRGDVRDSDYSSSCVSWLPLETQRAAISHLFAPLSNRHMFELSCHVAFAEL